MKLLKFLSHYMLLLAVACLYLFLYIPMLILIIFSFNKVAFPPRWIGFSWRWYQELLYSSEIWQVFANSLIIAMVAVILSLSMGLLLVFYGSQGRLRSFFPLFYSNLLLPEIVTAVSLLTLFTYLSIQLGFSTLIAGHTLLGLGFVVPILSIRFAELDKEVIEASLDLGASINQTFWHVVIPSLKPALIAAGLLVFIISFDDFIISFFCAGATTQTLSLYIFATIRTGVTPIINALSTVLLVISALLVIIFSSLKTTRIF